MTGSGNDYQFLSFCPDVLVEIYGMAHGYQGVEFAVNHEDRHIRRRGHIAAIPPWNWGGTKVEFELEGERATLVGARFCGWTWKLYVAGNEVA